MDRYYKAHPYYKTRIKSHSVFSGQFITIRADNHLVTSHCYLTCEIVLKGHTSHKQNTSSAVYDLLLQAESRVSRSLVENSLK